MIFVPVPFTAVLFFFSSWLTMVFWGIIAPDTGLRTIGYPKAMLVPIALCLVVAPAVLLLRGRRSEGAGPAVWGWWSQRRYRG